MRDLNNLNKEHDKKLNENKKFHKLNDIVYVVHGNHVVKGIIEELILHYTQKEVITKYIIRPYGLENFITIDAKNIYSDIDIAKNVVIDKIKNTYSKDNIIKNYEEGCRINKEKFDEQLNNFDKNFDEAIEMIKNISNEYYDNLETHYQEQLKKSKDSDEVIKKED